MSNIDLQSDGQPVEETPASVYKPNDYSSQTPPEQSYEPVSPLPQIGLYGLGGWLIWFQIRIYFGFFSGLGNALAYDYFLLYIVAFIPLIGCLVLFYQKKMSFRIWYIVGVGVAALLCLVNAMLAQLIGLLIVEGLIITALFRSERVKNTFN